MAERLDDYNFKKSGDKKSKYPWDQWLDGSIWRLKRGRDFPTSLNIADMRGAARQQAFKRRLRLRSKSEGKDALVIQAYRDTTE